MISAFKKIGLMTQDMAYSCLCSMFTWHECVFYFWVINEFINVNYIQLIDDIVQFCILAKFLSTSFVCYSERSIDVSLYIHGTISFIYIIFCFIYFEVQLLDAYTFRGRIMWCWWVDLLSICNVHLYPWEFCFEVCFVY